MRQLAWVVFLVLICSLVGGKKKRPKTDGVVGFTGQQLSFKFNNNRRAKSNKKVENLVVPIVKSEGVIGDPTTLMGVVESAWTVMVEHNQAGLTGGNSKGKPPPMTEDEAHFQYTRARQGLSDSARLLMVFSAVPNVATAAASGSKLLTAAISGDVDHVFENTDTAGSMALVRASRLQNGATALHLACSMGHLNVVKRLLEEGADPEETQENGLVALHIAASMGHVDIVNLLLKYKAEVNAEHPYAKSTSLHFAAEMGHHRVVKALCNAGANPEAVKTHGGRPIHVAADSDQPRVVRTLLKDCGADPNSLLLGDTTALYLAAQNGRDEVVKMLSKYGANLDFTMPLGGYQKHMTVRGGKAADNPYPHQVGSDPSQAGFEVGNGATALHAAVENGHYDSAKILLDAGAKQLSSMKGVSPLILTLQYRHPKIALLLLNYEGAKINHWEPAMKQTALQISIAYRYRDVSRRLIELGARPGGKDKQGHSALSLAVGNRDPQLVYWLLQAGLAPDTRLTDSQTILYWSTVLGVHKLSSFVIERAREQEASNDGAALIALINARTKADGRTPLHAASLKGDLEHVNLLLKNGANLELKTNRANGKKTALMLAVEGGHTEVVEALVIAGAAVSGIEDSLSSLKDEPTKQALRDILARADDEEDFCESPSILNREQESSGPWYTGWFGSAM